LSRKLLNFGNMKKATQLLYPSLILSLLMTSCNTSAPKTESNNSLESFLKDYNTEYVKLITQSSEASWAVNTKIVEGDSTNAIASKNAEEAFAKFTGKQSTVEMAQKFLKEEKNLTEIQTKQLKKIIYLAGNNPEAVKDIVAKRIVAETKQTETLFGFQYMLNNKKTTTNYIDSVLSNSNDLALRMKAWESSKEVGKVLGSGLENLQKLRNETVKGLGYSDFFNYQVSDYGMTTEEMMKMNEQFIKEVWPMYRELHTYARYELAKRYKVKEVPDLIPAHWLTNRWGQQWQSMITVKGLNLDSILAKKSPEWIVKKGEEFYVSLGYPKLPSTFWEKSSLYPVPASATYKKNNHASAWHINLDQDVRSLMSVEPNQEWYETVNHELGHIYYYLSYSNKDVPFLLREGANRAYHEAFGTMIGLVAMQKPFLAKNGILPKDAKSDEMQELLKQAMQFIPFIPFSSGTMTHFEHDLYANNLPKSEYNSKWYEYVKKYQGIVPPNERNNSYCDAATKTHINDDAAQYYDYAISQILLFQVHHHIATKILKQDPHNTLYYGSKEAGDFLRSIMVYGGSRDWRVLLKEKLGEDLTAKPMLEYFAPLMDYLKKENKGRKYTLPESI